jgi:hypothetical protein
VPRCQTQGETLQPTEAEWSFRRIAETDRERAERLESAPSFSEIVRSLAGALEKAIHARMARICSECKRDQPDQKRALVQFHVDPVLYDRFFNARTGYRAQFWVEPKDGVDANIQCVKALNEVLKSGLAEDGTAHISRAGAAIGNGQINITHPEAADFRDASTCEAGHYNGIMDRLRAIGALLYQLLIKVALRLLDEVLQPVTYTSPVIFRLAGAVGA